MYNIDYTFIYDQWKEECNEERENKRKADKSNEGGKTDKKQKLTEEADEEDNMADSDDDNSSGDEDDDNADDDGVDDSETRRGAEVTAADHDENTEDLIAVEEGAEAKDPITMEARRIFAQ